MGISPAELVLRLIYADLLTCVAVPGRLRLGLSWRQWFPDQEATATSAQLARVEAAAAALAKQPAQMPEGWT